MATIDDKILMDAASLCISYYDVMLRLDTNILTESFFPTISVSGRSVLKEKQSYQPHNHGFSNKQKLNPKQYCGKYHNKKSRHLGY